MIVDTLLVASVIYVIAISFGYLLEKYLRMPWMFTIVVFGMVFSALGLFTPVVQSTEFTTLSKLGVLALLFIIGLDLDLKEIRSLGAYILAGGLILPFVEGISLSLLFCSAFQAEVSNSLLVALVTGITFSTVGEVTLLAVLNEFNIVKTRFGQLTLGLGVFDDALEVLMLTVVAVLPSITLLGKLQETPNLILIAFSLAILLFTTFLLVRAGSRIRGVFEKVNLPPYISAFLILIVFFSLTAFSAYTVEDLDTVAAIMSGIIVQQIFPSKILKENRKAINFLGYFFLSPFFFIRLGANVSLSSILAYPLLTVLIVIVSFGSKVLASSLFYRRLLGLKYAFIMGIGLCVKFSTSVVAENMLFTSGLITRNLFSAIIAAYIVMKPLIVGIYSWFLGGEKNRIAELFSIQGSEKDVQ